MNKYGFTIVELMSTIILIGVISLIATTAYNKIGQKTKQNQYVSKVSLIEIKACEYASILGGTNIKVDQLVKNGFLQADNEAGEVINPVNGELMNCYLILITKENGFYYAKMLESQNTCEPEN